MPARPAADRAPLDVSGRPLALRDVDLDAFLHPKAIAVIGASQRPARPNTAMTNKFAAWSKANKAKFYPINPGHEDASWERFYKEGIDRFLSGRYDSAYENRLIEEFQSYLPEHPPWKK